MLGAMTTTRSSGSRRTVLTATLAATAGLVGGMALKTVGPSPSSASTSVTNASTPSLDDQNSAGVWIDRHGDEEGDDAGGRVFQPAVPPSGGSLGSGGPVMSSHGS
jgi:hypothetical protein